MDELINQLLGLGVLLALAGFGMWVGGAAVTAWAAGEKGRAPLAWFAVAFFLSPLVALMALNAVPALPADQPISEAAWTGWRRAGDQPAPAASRG